MKKMTPEELEKFIHQQLRSLPARPAPRSLESRVLSALEQRASIPWYHQSWSYWPATVRVVFLIFATAIAGGMVAAFYSGFDSNAVAAQAGERLGFVSRIYHVATWISSLVSQVVASIPPLWLYGGMAFIATLYATFLGLGAAAYRTLYRNI